MGLSITSCCMVICFERGACVINGGGGGVFEKLSDCQLMKEGSSPVPE